MQINNLENKRLESQINDYQSKLLPYAYNIVGDLMEAEDIVQEVLNKFYLGSNEHIEKPYSYLVKSVINRAINHKKLLRSQKEQYPGAWLPTPVFTEEGIYSRADRQLILNYSLLVLMEQLNPRERAVFILKETFDFQHSEIAEALDIATENSRQLLKRAKQKLEPHTPDAVAVKSKDQHMLEQLSEAILKADVEKVKLLLSAHVQAISDGGPKLAAAKKVIIGEERVTKLLHAMYRKYSPESAETRFTTVNHKPAVISMYNGAIFRCIIFEWKEKSIDKIFIIVNPDKLKALNFLS